MTKVIKRIRPSVVVAVAIIAGVLPFAPASAWVAGDGAGYRGIDTATSGGPPTSGFRDVKTLCGSSCRLNAGDDQIIPLGPASGQPAFPFRWSSGVVTEGAPGGSASQATVWADTNGYISFVQPAAPSFASAALPNTTAPNAIVAAAWSDLNPSAAVAPDGIYFQITGTAPNRTMYIQWSNVRSFSTACTGVYTFNFEFALSESSNAVTVYYGSNFCSAQSAVGGQENSAGTTGLTYFNGTAIPDNIAVRYSDVLPPVVSTPTITCGTAGSNGWCRSATNSVTLSDNNDMGAIAVGTGVKTRAWYLGGVNKGSYVNGSAVPVTNADGFYTAYAEAIDGAGGYASSSLAFLKVDTQPPSLSGVATSEPNAVGWYTSDVSVQWTATDATSGVASPPATGVIAGEGTNLSASTTVNDLAGNSTSATVGGIKIDRTPPATSASAPSGWSKTGAVTLSATDNLSGVARTSYRIDGGEMQQGTSVTMPEGSHTLEFWSEDVAGNSEEPVAITVLVDSNAPTITHEVSPAANPAAWHRSPATVTFTCSDAESIVVSCTAPSTVVADGAGQTVAGAATDAAGNTANDAAVVNLDRTAPAIATSRTPAANAAGWNNTPVVVTFTCSDALSGVVACPVSRTLGSGAGQQAGGVAADAAGNTTSASVTGVNVDAAPPVVSGAPLVAANAKGWHAAAVTIRWTCSDDLSGVVACPSNTVVTDEGVVTVTSPVVLDRAGNSATATVVVRIDRTAPVIGFDGQSPPPNEAGWNRTAVELTWRCSDSVSGVDATIVTTTMSSQTAGANGTGTCVDRAGNAASSQHGPVRIDSNAPSATITTSGAVTLAASPLGGRIAGTATDLVSGVDRVTLRIQDLATGAERLFPTLCANGCAAAGLARWELPASLVGPGVYRVLAHAADVAGNEGAESAPATIVVV